MSCHLKPAHPDLNTYDILNAETLILAESSVKVLETILNK